MSTSSCKYIWGEPERAPQLGDQRRFCLSSYVLPYSSICKRICTSRFGFTNIVVALSHVQTIIHTLHTAQCTCFRDDDMDPAHAECLRRRRERERDKHVSETPERREEWLRVRRERDRAKRAIRVANATADATQGPPAAFKCCPEGTTLCRKCRPETGPTAADKCCPDRMTCC